MCVCVCVCVCVCALMGLTRWGDVTNPWLHMPQAAIAALGAHPGLAAGAHAGILLATAWWCAHGEGQEQAAEVEARLLP